MNVNALVEHKAGALALSEDDLMKVLQSSLYPGAAVASIKMAVGYCRAAGLDIMQKPVHIVPMWDAKAGQMRDVIMPGVGLYRTQAARTGCAGITEPEYGPDVTGTIGGQEVTYPQWCRVTVKRRQPGGQVDEFTAREFWIENYAVKGGKEKSIAPNAMWTKRPYGQLAKCAEAQALRKAFPEVGSAPAAEEMEGKTIEGEYIDAGTGEIARGPVPAPAAPAAPPTWPADAFSAQLPRWTKAVEAGLKTADDILALARSKGALTAEQEARIKELKPKPAEPPPVSDPFVADMEAAEGAAQ